MKTLQLDIGKTISFKNHLAFTPDTVKEMDDNSTLIKGYASTFGNEDYMGDIMVRGCFRASIMENQGKWPVLFNHESSQQVGMNIVAKETTKGLYVESQLYTDESDIPKAKEAVALIRKAKEIGHPMGLSVGGFVKKLQPEYDGGKRTVRILEFSILEHSITAIPANPKAVITQQKSFNTEIDEILDTEENRIKISHWNSFEKNNVLVIDFLSKIAQGFKHNP